VVFGPVLVVVFGPVLGFTRPRVGAKRLAGVPFTRVSVTSKPQDHKVLAFLAEHRCAIAPQVQALLNCSPRSAQQRLRELQDRRLAQSQRIFAGRPSTWRITAAGLRAIGSSLAPPRLHLSQYVHDLGLGWLWLAARTGGFGDLAAIHSERSLRCHDASRTPASEPLGVGLGTLGPRGGERWHYPDLLLATPAGNRIAVELELSSKSHRRLSGIMLAYAADARIDAVLYLAGDRGIAARVQRASRDAGIGELVRIQPVAQSIQGAPDAGRHRALAGPVRAVDLGRS
jgi:hypothetical protein